MFEEIDGRKSQDLKNKLIEISQNSVKFVTDKVRTIETQSVFSKEIYRV